MKSTRQSKEETRTPGASDQDPLCTLAARYQRVRATTERLCAPLATEDYVIQTMEDVSPTKWHLAHTTWYFETFILEQATRGYRHFHPEYRFLFNSYYNTIGPMWSRPLRGFLSRPTVEEVYAYRHDVDAKIDSLLRSGSLPAELMAVFELGLNHEQQHQELILTDVKHVLAANPLRPQYREPLAETTTVVPPLTWSEFAEGVQTIGFEGDGFSFDNEGPRHRVWLNAFGLADRLITNGEYLQFMAEGGYEQPELWLSDGWTYRAEDQRQAPLYWERRDDEWWTMSMAGFRRVAENEPVCHLSFYEADAYARWAGARLPSEAEWEIASVGRPIEGNFQDDGLFHPRPLDSANAARLYGDVWQWTRSSYAPYPGFVPPPGAVGEYNGKFMSSQMVLRGGSCVTPRDHVRATYRNFFYPASRWQFSGLRLARDVD